MYIAKRTGASSLIIAIVITLLGFIDAGTAFAADASPHRPHPTTTSLSLPSTAAMRQPIISENLCTDGGGQVVIRPDGTKVCEGGRWDGAGVG